jgi:aspartate beta-hydroxylase
LSHKPIPELKQASWMKTVAKQLPALQQEAAALMEDPSAWISFFGSPRGQSIQGVLRCDTPASGWDVAHFFRQGQRTDTLHERCPEISAALASLPLCQIPGQAPEACLSLLLPKTTVLPHHGVTNTRLIVQIPLAASSGSHLSFTGEADQEWKIGTPVVYDDTFEHADIIDSDDPKVSLMVDIWHPDLSDAEKTAITEFVQASQSVLQ